MKQVLIFTGKNCLPCQSLKMALTQVQKEHPLPVRVIEAGPTTQAEFEKHGVRSVPVMMLTANGEEISRVVGGKSREQLVSLFRTWKLIGE